MTSLNMENKQVNRDCLKRALLYMGLSILAVLLIFNETLISMVSIWWRSETYAHGFFILPISLYLIWQKRHEALAISPQPSYKPLFLIVIAGAFWLLASMVDVLVIQQIFLISMILLVVWIHLGWALFKRFSFPLFFLFFMIPAGDVLIPTLMEFTADFTVKMVRLTGIPIYREGLFFSLPSGDWSVVEACSGIRYLIASITLGVLYAYMTYNSLKKRAIFILLSFLLPILANGLRAFMIVMIGHFSGMTLAVGVDHLIYGWLFFGIVMFLLFWLGSFWADKSEQGADQVVDSCQLDEKQLNKKEATLLLLVIVLSAVWPLKMNAIANDEMAVSGLPVTLAAPLSKGTWRQSVLDLTGWEPNYIGYKEKTKSSYQSENNKVELFLTYYSVQKQGEELIGWQNVLAPEGQQQSKEISRINREEQFEGASFNLVESRLKLVQEGRKFLVWRWNWIYGLHTADNLKAKLQELKLRLLGERGEAGIIVIVEYIEENDDAINQARVVLKSFVNKMLPEIEKSLENAANS